MDHKPTYEELKKRISELESFEAAHRRREEMLSKEALRYHTIFETANDSIFIMEDFRFVECNKKALVMFGCGEEKDILGFSPWDFSPLNQPDGSNSKEKAMEMMSVALTNKPRRFYWKHIRKDGSAFDTEVSLNLLKAKQRNALQAIVRDIT
jgi:PAS domain S-box-containing protein